VRAAVGGAPVGVERLAGGSKKGVYRLLSGGGDSVVVYVWSAALLGAVAGPLRLLDGGLADREFMREIAEWHTGRVLDYVSWAAYRSCRAVQPCSSAS
jgi:hypothetical protein